MTAPHYRNPNPDHPHDNEDDRGWRDDGKCIWKSCKVWRCYCLLTPCRCDPPDALEIHNAAGPCWPRYHRSMPGGGRCRCGLLPPHDPQDARFCYCGAERGHFGWQGCKPKPGIETS